MTMKKLVFLLFLVSAVLTSDAQYYRRSESSFLLGVNAGYTYPLGDFGKLAKNGIGGNISAKYLINDVIGIGFETGYHSFQTKIPIDDRTVSQQYKCKIIPALLETTFYIPTWDRSILPYAGLHFGAYIINVNIKQKSDGYDGKDVSKSIYKFSPGIGPHIGVLFELSDKINLDIKVRGDYVVKIEDSYELDEYQEGNIGFNKMLNIGANIGLLYRF